jgi:hypothetical protein
VIERRQYDFHRTEHVLQDGIKTTYPYILNFLLFLVILKLYSEHVHYTLDATKMRIERFNDIQIKLNIFCDEKP